MHETKLKRVFYCLSLSVHLFLSLSNCQPKHSVWKLQRNVSFYFKAGKATFWSNFNLCFLKVQKSNHLTFFKGETKLPSQFETNSFRKVEFFSSSCTVVWLYGLSKGEGVKRKNMRFLSIRRGETKLSYWKYPINLIWIHYLKSGLCYSLQVVE